MFLCFSLISCNGERAKYEKHFEGMGLEFLYIPSNESWIENSETFLDSLILWSIDNQADYSDFDDLSFELNPKLSRGSTSLLYAYLARVIIARNESERNTFIDSVLPDVYPTERKKRLSRLFPKEAEAFYDRFIIRSESDSLSERDILIFNALSSDNHTFNNLIDTISLPLFQKSLLCFAYSSLTRDESYLITAEKLLISSWPENSKHISAATFFGRLSPDSILIDSVLNDIFEE